MEDKLLTTAEVGDILGMSDQAVRRLIRSRKLPAINLGSAKSGYRVRQSALDAFLRERETVELVNAVTAAVSRG